MKIGAEILLGEKLYLIERKRIGVITNHSAILSNGEHLIDSLISNSEINIISLFGPEHGIRGDTPDGI